MNSTVTYDSSDTNVVIIDERGRICCSGFDVFKAQPPEESSPLWAMPGICITPQAPDGMGRSHRLLRENAMRFEAGEPLVNLMRPSDAVDLLIADIMMMRMDGRGLVGALRVGGCMTRPFHVGELLRRIGAVLRRTRDPADRQGIRPARRAAVISECGLRQAAAHGRDIKLNCTGQDLRRYAYVQKGIMRKMTSAKR